MPAYTGTTIRSNLINTLNDAMSGDRTTADVAGVVFNTTLNNATGQQALAFTSFLTAKAPVAEGVSATATVITLESSQAAAQFRVGDVAHLIHTNGTATAALTVNRVTPVTQEIGFTAAPGIHPPGSLVVRPDPSAAASAVPGGASPGASAGAPLDNMRIASFLTSIENFCGNNSSGWGSTQNGVLCDVSLVSNLVIDGDGPVAGPFSNTQSLVGATCTFTDGAPTQAALRGQRARVTAAAAVGVAPNIVVTLNLDQFESAPDAAGVRTALTQWALTPNATDIFLLDLDLTSHNKLAELGEAGGDMTTMVSSLLTMHRKLDPGSANPEIPQLWEDQVWQHRRGTEALLTKDPTTAATATAFTGGATRVVVAMDEAVGDIPFPLSGQVRLLSLADNVNSAGGSAPPFAVGSGGWVAYTRAKGSNVLNCAVTPAAANFEAGTRVQLRSSVNGLAVNKGFSPTVDPKDISGILWELMEAVRQYNPLEGA